MTVSSSFHPAPSLSSGSNHQNQQQNHQQQGGEGEGEEGHAINGVGIGVGNLRIYGSTTNVPDNDYCRLSYYLKCCIIGCGIDFVFDPSLLDYQNLGGTPPLQQQQQFDEEENENVDDNHHNGGTRSASSSSSSSSSRYDQIYQLVHDIFRLDILLNKVIFIDDENILMPQGVSNVFYHVETVSEFIQQAQQQQQQQCSIPTTEGLPQQQQQQHPPSPSSPAITQRHTRSQKVMICSTEWLQAFYIGPISRLNDTYQRHSQQHRQHLHSTLPSSSTTTNTYDWYRRSTSSNEENGISPQPNEVLSASTTSLNTQVLQVQQQQPTTSTTRHCEHCDGQRAACTCTYGCSRSLTRSHCRMIHSFPCNGFGCHKRKILGPRYKCRLCPLPYYNLCRRCYHSKTKRQHHQRHHHRHGGGGGGDGGNGEQDGSIFELIPRIGSPPTHTTSEMEEISSGGNDIRPDEAVSSSSSTTFSTTAIFDEGISSNNVIAARSTEMMMMTEEQQQQREQTNSFTPPPSSSPRQDNYHHHHHHRSIGETVHLVGITSLPQVTGQEAIIFEILEDRYLVHVPCLSIMLCVQPHNMISLSS